MPQQKKGRKQKTISLKEKERIKNIGLRLKEIRENLSEDGYYENQEYFASDCKIKVGTLKAVETGRRMLPIEDAIKIAQKCETSLDYIYCISDIKNSYEEKFIPKLLQEDFIIESREKSFTSEDGKIISLDILDLSIKESLIQYFTSASNLKKQLKNKEIDLKTYESELLKLEEKYKKESLKGTRKQQVLIPREIFKEEYIDPTALFSALEEATAILYSERKRKGYKMTFKNKNDVSKEEIKEELNKISNIN